MRFLILALTLTSMPLMAKAANIQPCDKIVKELSDKIFLSDLLIGPAMVTPDHQGAGYLSQYSIMQGANYANYQTLVTLLKKTCEEKLHLETLVKAQEI